SASAPSESGTQPARTTRSQVATNQPTQALPASSNSRVLQTAQRQGRTTRNSIQIRHHQPSRTRYQQEPSASEGSARLPQATSESFRKRGHRHTNSEVIQERIDRPGKSLRIHHIHDSSSQSPSITLNP